MAQQPLVGHDLTVEASRSHSIGPLGAGDEPYSENGLTTPLSLPTTPHNIHKTQTYMPPAGFERAIPASEGPQTHALHCAATMIGTKIYCVMKCK